MASEYKPAFRREGVLYEIETLAEQKLTPKVKDEPASHETSSTEGPAQTSPPIPTPPSVSRKSSGSHGVVDPKDTITLRARVVRFRYLSGSVMEVEDKMFAKLRSLVGRIGDGNAKEEELRGALGEVAGLFVGGDGEGEGGVSSFELMQSGLVDALLEVATVKERAGAFFFVFFEIKVSWELMGWLRCS